ncbi:sulfate/molybdate ABC transporter ATP-binding protein [Limnoglobus roseus]|uniref:Sulfate ABC transporter ATP-binding protein n=1 Tax=Limnoglobus roseus TaxID=2598579 RepID=A0A5C1AAW1_9BACT|nr:sulfate/molybdate ABC transporter ATP-binding protein [Limnoglobus roseus]QEL15313.1 sulfate ABC transporter ATP-binding protein [Limnoglobus roseus]
MSITVRNATKKFGTFTALDNVSLDVPEGELLALLGPSGSGKTTLLRIIGGLEHADAGTVHHSDNDVTRHSAKDRNFGFVFQHYALFKHMTVFENVAFSLRVRNWKNGDVTTRVNELLHLVRLENHGQRYPAQLSGGQRQRIALARALAARPRVLLLDEPFGALDARVRTELRQWLRKLHDEVPVTTIFVTHDQEEAFEVSDRVVVMNAGKIEQAGTPQEVFDHPANAFVMDFLGQVNVFHGRVHEGKAIVGDLEFDLPSHREDGPTKVFVRPHELDLATQANGVASMHATVKHIVPAGAVTRVLVSVVETGLELNVDLPPYRSAELKLKKGDAVFVLPRKVRVFEPDYAI